MYAAEKNRGLTLRLHFMLTAAWAIGALKTTLQCSQAWSRCVPHTPPCSSFNRSLRVQRPASHAVYSASSIHFPALSIASLLADGAAATRPLRCRGEARVVPKFLFLLAAQLLNFGYQVLAMQRLRSLDRKQQLQQVRCRTARRCRVLPSAAHPAPAVTSPARPCLE